MQKLLFFFAWLMLTASASSQRIRTNSRVNATTPVSKVSTVVSDTSPVKYKPKHIYNPTSKYAKLVTSVYSPRNIIPQRQGTAVPSQEAATPGDSTILVTSISKVLSTIRRNYTADIDAYVDTLNELSKIKGLRWENNKVYRSSLLGLSQNMLLLDNIFLKPAFDEEDIEMIDYIFRSNDSLVKKIQFNNYETMMKVASAQVFLNIIDHNNNPVPYATCYFVDKLTWRDIGNSKKCPANPSQLSCDAAIIPDLDTKAARNKLTYSLPSNNTRTLSYGLYHLLIIKDNVISFHEIVPFDIEAGLTKTIKLQNGQQ
ncbi:hypothetical protein ESA94_16270 [Lacibacter luteus]|uniref:Gliding motility-associated protein GldM N-terminal domain-containing protein n=1 Tax=Lacibacter luteus TaxID=2508719 RepID=A0A4Q1CGI6_9BACT|nr:hypothetical protein [Lacibacter luteus]RXK58941.1 hypothetical protein ESA94_16270 [Lacibacter luteus]